MISSSYHREPALQKMDFPGTVTPPSCSSSFKYEDDLFWLFAVAIAA